MQHHPPSQDIENQTPALRTTSLLKKTATAAPVGPILTAASGVPSTPLARRTALGTLNILGQSNVSATPLSNKRPLTSLFAGVKKLGLGKAVRVVPEQQHQQELEEDDTSMPVTPSAPPQQPQQQQQPQPQSSPNVIVTTPAPTKRVKASPPTPISLSLNEPTPASVVAVPIPSPLSVVASSATPSLLSMPPSTPAPASLLAAPSSLPLLQIVAPTPAPVLSIPSHVSPPARLPTPVATPLVASHPPPAATVSPPSVGQVTPAPAPAPAASVASQHIPSRSSTPAAEVCPIIRSDAPVRQDKGDSRFLLNKVLYTKLGTIGKGGSSLVYKVIDGKGRIYALKEMNIASNHSAQQANVHTPDYISEVNTLYRMRDSSYAIRLDVAQEDTQNHFFYMLMECGSCDLDRHLQTVRSQLSMTPDAPLLPSATVRYFWAAMLRCVNAIHSVTPPILHTDLKPVNFVFSSEAGTLKLIDFGIAKTAAEGSGPEQTGVIFSNPCGTLNFMSPESVTNGGELHRSSDIWSLGCILYSWIYGEPPFGRFTNQSMKLYAIQNKDDPTQNEPVYFHREIKVIEKVASEAAAAKALKGNGLVVQMDHKGCTITRTYPSMPAHLVGIELPRETMRLVDPRAIDALRRCLQRNPKERATAAQLLQHKYLFDAPSVDQARMTYDFHDQIDRMMEEHRSEIEQLKARLRQYEAEDA